MQNYFEQFRTGIIGNTLIQKINGEKKPIIYADWTASGRLYQPIESFIQTQIGPYIANTHTESNLTGTAMTQAYHQAQQIIKQHVNATKDDVLISDGAGMTGVINKFQRILGLRIPEKLKHLVSKPESSKPLVLITHMEHHSNQTSWLECDVTLRVINRGEDGLPDLAHMRSLLEQYKDRPLKIGSFSACSNVTGIVTDYHAMAAMMHEYGGVCFADFSASAPYVEMNMHPHIPEQKLDAIFFSPHKFLGGPGSSGILIFDKKLYRNKIPDHPGGGTVSWTNPWGEHQYFDDIEVREDGGTPPFLQTIRVALAIQLKEQMGLKQIKAREHSMVNRLMNGLAGIPSVEVLEKDQRNRICTVSFYVKDQHYNLIVRLLSDKFGIQCRGGCSCAGTYGHILLDVDQHMSNKITDKINTGDLSDKPGWIRLSFHPTAKDSEIDTVVESISELINNIESWQQAYTFNATNGEFEAKESAFIAVDLNNFNAIKTSTVFDRIFSSWFTTKRLQDA